MKSEILVPPVKVGWCVGGAVWAHVWLSSITNGATRMFFLLVGLESPEYWSCHGTNYALHEHRCVMLALGIVRHGDVDVNARMKRVVIDFR
jgi:hypothetical protein